jgi:predicted RNA-binding Zn-ribbon protein involved in translation (DUF1610 family)
VEYPWEELKKLKRQSQFLYWGYLPGFAVLTVIFIQVVPSESVFPVIVFCFILYSVYSSRQQKKINKFICPQCGNLFYSNKIMFNSARNNCSHCGIEIDGETSKNFEITNPQSKYTPKSFFSLKVFGTIFLIMGLGNFIYGFVAYFQPEWSVGINENSYTDRGSKIEYMLLCSPFMILGFIFLFFPKSMAKKLERFLRNKNSSK